MARDFAYDEAEKKIEKARRSNATELYLNSMELTELPETIGQLIHLQSLDLFDNQLTALPESLGNLTQLEMLRLKINQLTTLPASFVTLQNLRKLVLGDGQGGNPLNQLPLCVRELKKLSSLWVIDCNLKSLPDWIAKLSDLQYLYLSGNHLTDLPSSILQLKHLDTLNLIDNPLNPELGAAYKHSLTSVKIYLRAKSIGGSITINEAKLILVGEGEVGKTCLMDALLGDTWQEHPSTHGIEIKSFSITNPDTQTEITLNGWDFGGQRVYRPTHQLFFSAPAVYLVVWKPREGPQQGFVKEWIKLVKHREPDAKILVVATHGGPQQRQPDIDRQELWDLFGRETVADFFFVNSKPDAHGNRKGIEELKLAIAHLAAELPEVGRSVPKSFQDVREAGCPGRPLFAVG
ncbi:MAG: ADP-ribosylation factor-like protein [Anaerolineales bacterium]|nr:ADP-ribosylation factor-like protein [Anaerolineales bacterium]